MKGHHHRLAALLFHITRLLHHIRCCLQCMRHISPRVLAAASPLHAGESVSQFCWRRYRAITSFTNYEQYASSKLTIAQVHLTLALGYRFADAVTAASGALAQEVAQLEIGRAHV